MAVSHQRQPHQAQVYEWQDDGTELEVSMQEQAVDGSRSWITQFGLVTQSITQWNTNGVRTTTTTSPAGDYTVQSYQDGLLDWTAAYSSNAVLISKITFGYDEHGRQNSSTDDRANTSTTSWYDQSDQMITNRVTATGLSDLVTVHSYDNRGRNWQTLLPDNTTVTREFHDTGLLKKTHGSRTYPVEYGYDHQGRMTTMKTWKDFTGNTGTAVTTWKYDGLRGFMTNKVDAAGTGPSYGYTSGGRLLTRRWGPPAGAALKRENSDLPAPMLLGLLTLLRPRQ